MSLFQSKVVSFVFRHGVSLGVGAFITLQVVQHYFPPKLPTTVQAPYVAKESPLVKEVPKSEVAAKIETLEPTPKQREKLEKKIGGSLPTGPLLSANEIRELCQGGTLVVSLEPAPSLVEGSDLSRVRVDVYPNERSFFALALSREFSVAYGRTFGGQLGSYVRAEFSQNFFRTGAAMWYVKGGVQLGLDESWHNSYVEAGARWTF